jgi:hypothetical protein
MGARHLSREARRLVRLRRRPAGPPALPPPSPAPAAAKPSRLELARDVASIVQAVATVLALLIGAAWTVHFLILNRETEAHADIAVAARDWDLGGARRLLVADITVKNIGKVLFAPSCLDVYVQLVSPVTPDMRRRIEAAGASEIQNTVAFQWPLVASKRIALETINFVIEPGETNHLLAEFIVPDDLATVMLYTAFQNPAVSRDCDVDATAPLKGPAWTYTILYDLATGGAT